MCTMYTNKNRIDAVLRVEKFSTSKSNIFTSAANSQTTLNMRSEITQKIYYNPHNYKSMSSVFKQAKENQSALNVQVTSVGIPYVQKEPRIHVQVPKVKNLISKEEETTKKLKSSGKQVTKSKSKIAKTDKKSPDPTSIKKNQSASLTTSKSELAFEISKIKRIQRNQIYALNAMMTALENQNFLEFCRDNNIKL